MIFNDESNMIMTTPSAAPLLVKALLEIFNDESDVYMTPPSSAALLLVKVLHCAFSAVAQKGHSIS
jgi:hypothetical protein